MTVNLAAHDICHICIHILAKLSRAKLIQEKERLEKLLEKHRRRKHYCNSLIRSAKTCVLKFKAGIRAVEREVADFYTEPVPMDLCDDSDLELDDKIID